MSFKHWIHHLFNPHCEICSLERECKNCDMLRQMLVEERFEKKRLLDNILKADKPIEHSETEESLPVNSYIPFRVRKKMLEEQSRAEAIVLEELKRNTPKSIDDLEREVGVSHAS